MTFWLMKEGLYDGEVERRCKLTLVFLTLIQNPLSSSTEKSPGIRPESATSSSPTYMNAIVIRISTIKYCKSRMVTCILALLLPISSLVISINL